MWNLFSQYKHNSYVSKMVNAILECLVLLRHVLAYDCTCKHDLNKTYIRKYKCIHITYKCESTINTSDV